MHLCDYICCVPSLLSFLPFPRGIQTDRSLSGNTKKIAGILTFFAYQPRPLGITVVNLIPIAFTFQYQALNLPGIH